MRAEFNRYGLPKFRKLVGVLQLAGAVGQLAGLFLPWVGLISAAGLGLMMMTGVVVRIRIKDTVIQTLPAATYAGINLYVVAALLGLS